ncbi:peptide chain release factor N(5)-glutamine methyltransferase [Altererythrobacter luteolus]|uniref:Release factor glutamine methyltransferase n=1 Tax=Pontixanthobacter luteolus TaxID=295089 RepID=A0A6I4V761_9SPHN|nr:peptide chain release factor N(5)-glutamine methyltransferase [Pontixanthobacter luteolus]MXP48124.1 peptide chain release factor N(5)-glutamine methyltransferase [Pontixanthobacter luteolus]
MTTVSAALREAASALEGASDTARLDAELLMAEALGMSRSEMLLTGRDRGVPPEFARLLDRRKQHEPVAYILGRQEFYGREFLVNPQVLIPRGDSETLVDAALRNSPPAARILDLGTGSGALLLTLLAELPKASGTGIDASLGAVSVAAANAARLGVADRAHILHADWNAEGWSENLDRFDLIIANPPYVETGAELAPSVRQFEPASALFAGADGLDDYRSLIPQLSNMLTPNGIILLEIGYAQADQVSQIAGLSGYSAELFRDLAHRPRALLLR